MNEPETDGVWLEDPAPYKARIAVLTEALREALDGWYFADSSLDMQMRISSDPPCEDEAAIARLRKLLPAPPEPQPINDEHSTACLERMK